MSEPRRPTDLSTRSWWRSAKRTVKRFREHDLTDSAAALTYYSVLSLFPALVALVSIVGLFGDPRSTTRALGELASQLGPASATRTLHSSIESLTAHRSAAGVLLVVGIGVSLWSASGYVGAFIRASNAVYEVREGRPFWKLRPLQLAVTLGVVLMLALVATMLVISGPVASAVGGAIGAGDAAVSAWNIVKWPILLVVVLTMFAVLYYVSPNVRLPGFRWITPGSVLALAVWVIASAGFALYVAHLALLLGLELNAELERSRELASGQVEAEGELQLEPRQAPG